MPCMRHWRSNPYRRSCSPRLGTRFQRALVPPLSELFASRTPITAVWRSVPRWNSQQLVRSDGDFNIHVKDHGNSDAILFADRLASLTSCSTYRSNSQVRRYTRPYNHRIGRGHRISRSWSTWRHLRPRFNVLLYTHKLRSHPIRSSNEFVRSWRGVDRPTLFEEIMEQFSQRSFYIFETRPFSCSLPFHTQWYRGSICTTPFRSIQRYVRC